MQTKRSGTKIFGKKKQNRELVPIGRTSSLNTQTTTKNIKPSKLSRNLEYFKPIERKKHRRELGSSIQAIILQKIKGS